VVGMGRQDQAAHLGWLDCHLGWLDCHLGWLDCHLVVGSQEVGSVHLGWLEVELFGRPPAPPAPQMAWWLARTRAKEGVALRSVWQ